MTASASMIPEASAEVASMALIIRSSMVPDHSGQSTFTRQRFIIMMNLCRVNADFPPWSGIIRAMEATSADASGILDAEAVMAMNKTKIMEKRI
ncbi:hypothetical protein CDAR_282341 [Caerostris darwini]|uniref:Uncharacterized protein n=1 Tax=Caerostris darwini TaxID=1538125 RepID=A0AAV4RVD6_9ARAC|nr:hypothetical protein CDAR_282341 [Caerostris darwini]